MHTRKYSLPLLYIVWHGTRVHYQNKYEYTVVTKDSFWVNDLSNSIDKNPMVVTNCIACVLYVFVCSCFVTKQRPSVASGHILKE